jgi:hypothetical protein
LTIYYNKIYHTKISEGMQIKQKIKDKITPEIFKTGELADMLTEGIILAGGCLRDTIMGRVPKDYDVFVRKDYVSITSLLLVSKGYENTASTMYTKTFKKGPIEVQLVFKDDYYSLEELIKTFDFTNVMLAVSGDEVEVGIQTLHDIEDKKVRINLITKPLDSLNRLCKYAKDRDVKNAYKYLIAAMDDKDHKVILGACFYDN